MSLDISCLNRWGIFTLEYRQLGKSYLVVSMDGLRWQVTKLRARQSNVNFIQIKTSPVWHFFKEVELNQIQWLMRWVLHIILHLN